MLRQDRSNPSEVFFKKSALQICRYLQENTHAKVWFQRVICRKMELHAGYRVNLLPICRNLSGRTPQGDCFWQDKKTKKIHGSAGKDHAWISKISLCERTDGRRTHPNSKDTFARSECSKREVVFTRKNRKYQNLPELRAYQHYDTSTMIKSVEIKW